MTVGVAELYGAENGVGDPNDRAGGPPAMMRRIVRASLRFRYLVIAFAIGMVFFGAAQLRHVPVDVFPDSRRRGSRSRRPP